jgi:peptidoglycan/LPS O-acetylase OafA/YrhL
MSSDPPGGPDRHSNNFGSLRLLFAAMVVVGHSPELIDGDTSREVLSRLFGTLTLGGVAVCGFFLISGFLVTKSYVETPALPRFFAKRLLRIYPGYLVNFLICALLVAPQVGQNVPIFRRHHVDALIGEALMLLPPTAPGAFASLPFPYINGSVWTIAYEFHCYLLAALLGLCGLYSGARGRLIVMMFVGACVLVDAAGALKGVQIPYRFVLGKPEDSVSFFAAFGVGSLHYLFRERMGYSRRAAAVAAAALVPLMFSPLLAHAAVMLLGGYLIFWFALASPVLRVSLFTNRIDLSYGLYLYAWPIQSWLIYRDRTIDPWTLSVEALLGASLAALASWTLLEKPSLDLLTRRRRTPASAPLATNA